jgi:hypothetical protein
VREREKDFNDVQTGSVYDWQNWGFRFARESASALIDISCQR